MWCFGLVRGSVAAAAGGTKRRRNIKRLDNRWVNLCAREGGHSIESPNGQIMAINHSESSVKWKMLQNHLNRILYTFLWFHSIKWAESWEHSAEIDELAGNSICLVRIHIQTDRIEMIFNSFLVHFTFFSQLPLAQIGWGEILSTKETH